MAGAIDLDRMTVSEQDEIGEIGDVVGFHLRLAQAAVYRNFSDTFAHLDMTQKQVSVLWLVNDHPGIAQAGVAREMQMDRATTMAIVNRLEARGLLERGKSTTDGRKQTLNLTDAGQVMLSNAKQAIRAHEDWLKARYTEQEVGALIELLTRLHS